MPSVLPAISNQTKKFKAIQNYIYLFHLEQFVILPTYPSQVSESLSSTFAATNILARSAPIMSFSYSGPRTLQFAFEFRRDMMQMINNDVSNLQLEIGEDYVDTLIRQLQASVIPAYADAEKMVNPPQVAVRLGDDLYIKGVINGGISTTYKLPLIETPSGRKYADVSISFTVTEIDPYDARTVAEQGGMRGLSRTLERSLLRPVARQSANSLGTVEYERLLL